MNIRSFVRFVPNSNSLLLRKMKMLKCTPFLKRVTAAFPLLVLACPVYGQNEVALPDAVAAEQIDSDVTPEVQARWPYFATVTIPASDDTAVVGTTLRLVDFFVSADVFKHARRDLTDLRIYASDGTTVPDALHILSPKSVRDVIPAKEFNRSEPEEGVHELTLELQRDDIEHNEVVVETSGTDFRRFVVISGSPDGNDWKTLVSGNVLHYTHGDKTLINKEFHYPNSRHRYLKVEVTPDPQIADGKDAFTFQAVTVVRQLDLPGTSVTTEATVSTREPTRHYGAPGSRWILDFGASVPCDRLEIAVPDEEFARDISLEAESLNALGQPTFYPVYLNENSAWQRRRGEPLVPIVFTFPEVQSQRLRLTIVDYRNKPLTLESVRGSAAARQIILEQPVDSKLPLKLYFGNQDAENTNYDFARNLPDSLPVVPVRAALGTAESNPQYVPAPKAFTERFPALIYVALGSVSLVLGAVIMNLSKAAISNHDATSND